MSGTSNERITESTPIKALDGLTPPIARTAKGNRRAPYRVGEWKRHLDPAKLEPCEYGYHYVTGVDVFEWLHEDLYVAEACPDHPPIDGDHKHVTCRLRIVRPVPNWDGRTRRLFAADCAESALLTERVCGREPDPRSWEAVSMARRYADGDATDVELQAAYTAAEAAAWGGARVVDAWGAARVAAWAANAATYANTLAVYDAAKATLYARWAAYVNGDPIPPVEPLYGGERKKNDQ
jgi:hypothetical protein